jgi:hypothetical protein
MGVNTMKVVINNNSVVIFEDITSVEDERGKEETPRFDPYHYTSGNSNDLTVEESVSKAADYIIDEIWRFLPVDDVVMLEEAIEKLIIHGKGRQAAYRIAGAIKKYYNEGLFRGLFPELIFEGVVDDKIDLDFVHETSA